VERLVKERLVGAAVLMAAAVILIPEMLSGPDRESREQPAQSRSDAPIKTYTIDLSHSPTAQPTPGVVDNRAPPPEEPPVQQASAPQPAGGDQAKPEIPQQEPSPAPAPAVVAPVVEQPTAASASAPQPKHPLASADPAPTSAPVSGRWAVQIGSYARQATAERIAKQLRDKGQSAFVMPVKSGSATLYRVRIGPMQDRASAEAALRDVKSAGAAIVPHP
jgi:DedD protein